MNSEHRRFLGIQLAVSAVLNSAISALFVWLMFGGLTSIALWGNSGLALDLVPTTFMITLMTGIALTLVTRSAVRSGKLSRLERRSPLPANVLLRALLLAAAATALLVPISVLMLSISWTQDWSYGSALLFKIGYGVALGTLVTPVVVLAALGDVER